MGWLWSRKPCTYLLVWRKARLLPEAYRPDLIDFSKHFESCHTEAMKRQPEEVSASYIRFLSLSILRDTNPSRDLRRQRLRHHIIEKFHHHYQSRWPETIRCIGHQTSIERKDLVCQRYNVHRKDRTFRLSDRPIESLLRRQVRRKAWEDQSWEEERHWQRLSSHGRVETDLKGVNIVNAKQYLTSFMHAYWSNWDYFLLDLQILHRRKGDFQ